MLLESGSDMIFVVYDVDEAMLQRAVVVTSANIPKLSVLHFDAFKTEIFMVGDSSVRTGAIELRKVFIDGHEDSDDEKSHRGSQNCGWEELYESLQISFL